MISIAKKIEKTGKTSKVEELAVSKTFFSNGDEWTVYHFEDGSKACRFTTLPYCYHSDNIVPIEYQKITVWEYFAPKEKLPKRWR